MKKLQILVLCLLALTLTAGLIARDIAVEGGIGTLNETIHGDTLADGTRVDVNTVYVLSRDAAYLVTAPIRNEGYPLYIKAADGAGALPRISPALLDDGSFTQLFNTQDDVTFENLYIETISPLGGSRWGGIRFYGEGSTIVVDGCHITKERGGAFMTNADNMDVTVTNCVIGNIGDDQAHGGNGRVLDTRGNDIGTVVFRNNTIYNIHDRILRTGGGSVASYTFDHNTVLHQFGRHGCFDLSNSIDVTITNNIIYNPLYQGNSPMWDDEQAHSDAPDFYLVTANADESGTLALNSLTMHNNNIFTDQAILDYYATNDSVDAPEVLSPSIAAMMGAAAGSVSFSEPLTFTNASDTPYDYLVQVYTDVNVEPLPANWSDIEPADYDAGYSVASISANGADDGSQLGDMNATLVAAREVAIDGGIGTLNETIHGDTLADGSRVDVNTVYVLSRDAAYLVTAPIRNEGYPLYIKAADGAGALPRISPALLDDGSFTQLFNTQANVMFKDLYIETISPLGGSRWGGIRFYGEGSTIVVDGCHITKERGGAFMTNADNMNVTVTNCVIGNIGDDQAHGGNGRVLDTRGNDIGTVVFRNNTIYNIHDRILRTGGGSVASYTFDHNTVLHQFGRHGCFDLSNSANVTITNNVIYNPLYQGNSPMWADEQAHSDAPDFYLVTANADESGALALESITMSNNNIYTDQAILDYYATNDSVDAPEVLSPSIAAMMGAAADDASFSEVLAFTNVSPTPYDYLVQVYADVNVEPLPANWSDIEPADYDPTYNTDAISATAATDGGALGDMNFAPGGSPVEAGDVVKASQFALQQNYPNPFNPTTEIAFTIEKASDVRLTVYNMVGQEVRSLVSKKHAAGTFTVTWDGMNDAGNMVPSGVYIYELRAGAQVDVKKMILMK